MLFCKAGWKHRRFLNIKVYIKLIDKTRQKLTAMISSNLCTRTYQFNLCFNLLQIFSNNFSRCKYWIQSNLWSEKCNCQIPGILAMFMEVKNEPERAGALFRWTINLVEHYKNWTNYWLRLVDQFYTRNYCVAFVKKLLTIWTFSM